MNTALELHDSVLACVLQRGCAVQMTIRPAYVHASLGEPGVDDGCIHAQEVVLEFADASVEGVLGSLPEEILDGGLEAGGETTPNMVKISSGIAMRAALTLYLSPDYRAVRVAGKMLSVRATTEPQYVREFRR